MFVFMMTIQRSLVALRGVVLLLAVLAGVPGCGDGGSGGAGSDYDLEIWAGGSDRRFGALQFTITHLGNRGEFVGRGELVDCEALVDAISAVNYQDGNGRSISAGIISIAGVQMPAAVFRCGFRTTEDVEPESFSIRVTDASDTNSQSLDPPPTVFIASVTER